MNYLQKKYIDHVYPEPMLFNTKFWNTYINYAMCIHTNITSSAFTLIRQKHCSALSFPAGTIIKLSPVKLNLV
jgi:hypothetical protein